jgi:Mn-dependent DtxR family transcriptional regulator
MMKEPINTHQKGINIMKILESAENYLETILILQKRNGTVRSIDIASELEYTKPSVSVAMKNLRENGYIEMDKMGHITLMDTGLAIAEAMYERHTALSNFLLAIGVSEHTAREDACRMEHIISEETFEAIKKHTQYLIAKQSENK